MRELLEAAQTLGAALGINTGAQEIPAGFSVPADWTVLAARMSSGADSWEFALGASPATIEALGGQDAALGTLAEALESQGRSIAPAFKATLADEASLNTTMPVVAGGAVVDGEAGVLVFVTGSATPVSSAGQSGSVASSSVRGASERGGMQILSDVSMTVTAELGRARMTVRELLELAPGAIVELDRTAGTPIDVLVNGTVVARGEVVVVDEEFGVRVTEIVGTENA